MIKAKLWFAGIACIGLMFASCEGSDSSSDPTPSPATSLKRVSVHDPSVVWDPNTQYYYIFGSHRSHAKTRNMMTWTKVTVNWRTIASGAPASTGVSFVTPATKTVKKGGQDVAFPAFDAIAWSKQGSADYNVENNLWAPDVIYNKAMNKWCMYMSINGDKWYSSIVLLTSQKINGPYLYQGPVVISGFYAGDSYKQTDLELAIGEQSSLPARYASPWVSSTKAGYPNCIDPCVFYDEDGNLRMSYGSWSGGIFILDLDENTGLRDYDVTYDTSNTRDPYFGKKIAGGYYSSGEASYIEHIGDYYYLFITNGGLAAGGVASDYNNGGYQMRVFRSENVEGPYVDYKNASALLSGYVRNFGPSENDGNRGVNIFGAYSDWGNQATGDNGERSQGHNSIIDAEDGRTYLVYHTRFQNRAEEHEVRVHQVYLNEDGWLVAAPFEYSGETLTNSLVKTQQEIATSAIPGKYKVLVHKYKLNHLTKAYASPIEVVLGADGSVSGDATGTWTITEGTCYMTVTISGTPYKGVMVQQTMEPTDTQVPAFTGVASTGVTAWAYRYAD